MDDDAPFLRAIQAAPGDVDLQLIYADWLEERGDPRAEFLRLRAALCRLRPGDTREVSLRRRLVRQQATIADERWRELFPIPDDVRLGAYLSPQIAGHIRRRPGMYLGSVDATGLHHLLFVLIDRAADAPSAQEVTVELRADGSCRFSTDGLPLEILEEDISLQPAGQQPCSIHSNLSLHMVCALSRECRIERTLAGKTWRQDYREGQVVGPARRSTTLAEPGTTILFTPDAHFGPHVFDYDRIAERLRLVGDLTKAGWWSRVIDQRGEGRTTSWMPAGLLQRVALLAGRPLDRCIEIEAEQDDAWFRLALCWIDDEQEGRIWGFANYHELDLRGPWLRGLRLAIRHVVRELLEERHLNHRAAHMDDCVTGMVAVVSMLVARPQCLGSTRSGLANEELGPFLYQVICKGLKAHFDAHPDEADAVCRRVHAASRTRVAAMQARRES